MILFCAKTMTFLNLIGTHLNLYGFTNNGANQTLSSDEIEVSKKVANMVLHLSVLVCYASSLPLKASIGLVGLLTLTTFYYATRFFIRLNINNSTTLRDNIVYHLLYERSFRDEKEKVRNRVSLYYFEGEKRGISDSQILKAEWATLLAVAGVTLLFGIKQPLLVALDMMLFTSIITFYVATAYFKWSIYRPNPVTTNGSSEPSLTQPTASVVTPECQQAITT